MKSGLEIKGLKEIKDFVNGLPAELNHKVMQTVNAEAAIPLVHKIHLLAPVGKTGNLADSIGVEKPSIKRANEIGVVNVGPQRTGSKRGHHAHLVEYGTRDRGKTGIMPKKPFVKPAFDQMKENLHDNINNILGKKVMAFAKRKIKNNGGSWSQV